MAVVATGFFDGVHIGHRLVIDTLVRSARERGEESVILTFWPHPRTVLQDDAINLRLLNTLAEKTALLKSLGVDRVEVLPFTKEFSRLSTAEYLDQIVKKRFKGTAILLGYDNRVGSGSGTTDQIAEIAEGIGLDVIRTERVSEVGIAVSSTKIRSALSQGNVEIASQLLCYDYLLHGVVVGGKRLGRTIGYPTVNMQLYEPLKLIPADGAYLSRVEIIGDTFYGMTNVSNIVETHIFGFDEEVYGLDVKVRFLRRVREEKKFSSLEDLRHQLATDELVCKQLIAQYYENR